MLDGATESLNESFKRVFDANLSFQLIKYNIEVKKMHEGKRRCSNNKMISPHKRTSEA